MSQIASIDNTVLKEAADWALAFRYGTPDPSEQQAFERWIQQSPTHAAAWARAESVFTVFSQVTTRISKHALTNLERGYDRRRSLRLLSTLFLATPAVWLASRLTPWREWTADVATATGERRSLVLPDSSQVVLNTASAVNIAFDATARRLQLISGEILVSTGTDSISPSRPFVVDTSYGVVKALGTRFSVRHLDENRCRVSVFQHSVEIRPLAGDFRLLNAGEQADFDASGVKQLTSVEESAILWEGGMLLARDMRLGDVIAELSRYRPGVLHCAAEVVDLRVSGALSLTDTDAALALLESNLQLHITRATPYWISIGPRS